eukprot:scaffold259898_cov27-Tisochrysis_lutea.AAC.5
MERAATAPEPQATLATAPHLGRPTPPSEAARQKALLVGVRKPSKSPFTIHFIQTTNHTRASAGWRTLAPERFPRAA